MSPLYLPICGIYLPFQVNLYVPNSKPSNEILFCMLEQLMYQLGLFVSSMLGGLFSRGVDSAPHSRENGWSPGCPVPCSNQIKIIANKTPPGFLLVGCYPLFRTSRGMCSLVVGEYKLYHSVWEPPIMCVAWKISRSLGCYADNESMPPKILFISVSNSSSGTSVNPFFPLRRAYPFTLIKSTSWRAPLSFVCIGIN